MEGRRRKKARREEGQAPDEATERAPHRPRTPDEERDALLAYAFRALAGKALTETELRTRLARRTLDAELAELVIRRVQELGYQNDAQVARAEGQRRTVGVHRVRQTLKTRGIAPELITDTLDARDPDAEQEAATALLSRRWAAFARKRDPRASAYAFLARRGFPGSVIWAAIHAQGNLPEPDDAPSFDEDLEP